MARRSFGNLRYDTWMLATVSLTKFCRGDPMPFSYPAGLAAWPSIPARIQQASDQDATSNQTAANDATPETGNPFTDSQTKTDNDSMDQTITGGSGMDETPVTTPGTKSPMDFKASKSTAINGGIGDYLWLGWILVPLLLSIFVWRWWSARRRRMAYEKIYESIAKERGQRVRGPSKVAKTASPKNARDVDIETETVKDNIKTIRAVESSADVADKVEIKNNEILVESSASTGQISETPPEELKEKDESSRVDGELSSGEFDFDLTENDEFGKTVVAESDGTIVVSNDANRDVNLTSEISQLKSELTEFQRQYEALNQQRASESSELQAIIDNLQCEKNKMQSALDNSTKEFERTIAEKQEVDSELAITRTAIAEFQAEKAKLDDLVAASTTRTSELETAAEQQIELKQKLEKAIADLTQSNDENTTLGQQLALTRTQLESAENRIDELETAAAEIEASKALDKQDPEPSSVTAPAEISGDDSLAQKFDLERRRRRKAVAFLKQAEEHRSQAANQLSEVRRELKELKNGSDDQAQALRQQLEHARAMLESQRQDYENQLRVLNEELSNLKTAMPDA